nr:hypothetical protein Itr_chr12CG13230 [Ipomoea trifida]
MHLPEDASAKLKDQKWRSRSIRHENCREKWRRVAREQTLALDPDKAEREKLSQVAGQEFDRRIFICEVYREQNKVANALDPLGVHQQTDCRVCLQPPPRPLPKQGDKCSRLERRRGCSQ